VDGGVIYRRLLRPVLFRLDPERAHGLAIRVLGWRGRLLRPPVIDPRLRVRLLGQELPGPIGLAAGADKNADAVPGWATVGLGFLEVGTVTPRPQDGNPRPRVFRLVDDLALVNRLGFNNAGADAMRSRLEALGAPPIPVAVNIGKNKTTPNEHAIDDYLRALELLGRFADWIVVNVSSPNTPGLRELQSPMAMRSLVGSLVKAAPEGRSGGPVPIVVKLAPDWEGDDLERTVDAVLEGGAKGLVATNTTLGRDGLRSPAASETGGLSGAPLREVATSIIRRIRKRIGPDMALVGVGGIDSADAVWEMLEAGADAVELYTALIYEGPGLVRRIHRDLVARMEREGVGSLGEVVRGR